MEAFQKHQITDSCETVEAETPYNTFEVLMCQVDDGKLTFEQAIAAYREKELGNLAVQGA